ncbi:hypothetical protein HHI36_020042 [Cryptolaemus montrouzieri]|uniref:Reverse transcriptase domain-containing protein n=1 Tax=Cryptolaemus montrouzieri TaxID=559131 RepID=A0ABD2N9F6_9CUCU
MCQRVETSSTWLTNFVDDTNVVTGNFELEIVVHQAKKIYTDISQWLCKDKLIVNENKTTAMLFSTNASKKERTDFIDMGDKQINFQESTKFLNKFMDWSHHIECLSKKLSPIRYDIRTLPLEDSEKGARNNVSYAVPRFLQMHI